MSETRTAAPALLIRRTFEASRERVFAAWTTPELLRQWFGPPGITLGECSFDARQGGQYRIVMQRPGNEDFVARGSQTELVFSHENLRDEESRERHAEGWNGILDNLATFL